MQMNVLPPCGLDTVRTSTYCARVCAGAWIYVLRFMRAIVSQPGTEGVSICVCVCVKVCVFVPPHLHLEQPFGACI